MCCAQALYGPGMGSILTQHGPCVTSPKSRTKAPAALAGLLSARDAADRNYSQNHFWRNLRMPVSPTFGRALWPKGLGHWADACQHLVKHRHDLGHHWQTLADVGDRHAEAAPENDPGGNLGASCVRLEILPLPTTSTEDMGRGPLATPPLPTHPPPTEMGRGSGHGGAPAAMRGVAVVVLAGGAP